MFPRICVLIVLLHLLGCSDSGKTFIPKSPDPPPTQAEGTLKPADATTEGKSGK